MLHPVDFFFVDKSRNEVCQDFIAVPKLHVRKISFSQNQLLSQQFSAEFLSNSISRRVTSRPCRTNAIIQCEYLLCLPNLKSEPIYYLFIALILGLSCSRIMKKIIYSDLVWISFRIWPPRCQIILKIYW